MLFGKKEKNAKQDDGKNLKLTSAYHQPQTEEEKMRVLESQLDFLRNPNHPDNLKKRAEEEGAAAEGEKDEAKSADKPAGEAAPGPRPVVPNRFAPPQQTLRSARALNEAVMNARKNAQEEAKETPVPAGGNPLLGAPTVKAEEKKDEGPQVTQQIPTPQANRQILTEKAEEKPAAPVTGGPHSMVAPAIQPPEGIVHPDIRKNTEMKDGADRPVPLSGAVKQPEAERVGPQYARRSEYRTAHAEDESAKGKETVVLQPIPVEAAVPSAQPAAAAPKAPGEPLKNPLPTPKKHVPKEMDFDKEPTQLDMHFDVVDMSGIDFFDIN